MKRVIRDSRALPIVIASLCLFASHGAAEPRDSETSRADQIAGVIYFEGVFYEEVRDLSVGSAAESPMVSRGSRAGAAPGRRWHRRSRQADAGMSAASGECGSRRGQEIFVEDLHGRGVAFAKFAGFGGEDQ